MHTPEAMEEIEFLFPAIKGTNYTVTSPKTDYYNCIAHAAQDETRWWWPQCHPDAYWPEGRPLVATVENFVQTFSTHLGYEACDSEALEDGFLKVVIYADGDAVKHMARQLPNGEWTSKLGDCFDISHTLTGVEGERYGRVARFLRRPIQE